MAVVALGVTGRVESPRADAHEAAIEILRVEPAASDSLLLCGLSTRGLPDRPSRETLLSGLPSSLVFGFLVRDAAGQDIGGSGVEIRIEPDLWEEIFFLRTPDLEYRLESLAEVEKMLAHMSPMAVMPLSRLKSDALYRIQVRLVIHPLAPSEIRRSREFLVGETELDDPERREVSVGLSSLLRFFLGRAEGEEFVSEASSGLFSPSALLLPKDADTEGEE